MTVWAADEITARDERPLIVSFPFQKPMSLRKASTSKITCRMEMICNHPAHGRPVRRSGAVAHARKARRNRRWHSEGTRGRALVAIPACNEGGHQWTSEGTRGHALVTIPACNEGGHQWTSEVNRGHQRGVRMALYLHHHESVQALLGQKLADLVELGAETEARTERLKE